jgi:1-acyl-sn-glycerol-3-phosphate acyltransferase
MRAAHKSLEQGWATGVFLEGTRTADGRIYQPKLGAVLIAAKAKAPLLPVCLWGTHKIVQKGSYLPKPVPVTVRIGELIDPPTSTDRQELEALAQRCRAEINAMHALGR